MIKIDSKEILIESKLLKNIFEEDYVRLKKSVIQFQQETKAKKIFLLDKNGKSIISNIDYNNTKTEKLIEETNKWIEENGGYFVGSLNFLDDSINISIIGKCFILIIVYDEESSLGLIRSSLRRYKNEIEDIFLHIIVKMKENFLIKDDSLLLLEPISDSELASLFDD